MDKGRHLWAFCKVGPHVCLLLTLSINALLQDFEHGGGPWSASVHLAGCNVACCLAESATYWVRMLPISHHVWASYRISLPIPLPKLKVESGCVLHLKAQG